MQVVAVNPGSVASHENWAEKFGFTFPICADPEKHVAAAFGALKPEGGIARSVILVNKQGVVTWAEAGSPSTEAILAAVDQMTHDDPDSTRLSSS